LSDFFMGEIRAFAFDRIPRGWMRCDGSVLQISTNQALFSLLGTFYGGDGIQTFALPDLRDRTPMHPSVGGPPPGATGGEATHALTVNEVPSHTHTVSARTSAAATSLQGALWATSWNTAFGTSKDVTMSPQALANAGGGQPHDNMPPYLTVTYAIAATGIYPSRS
jgi:microcystin-dependent protein